MLLINIVKTCCCWALCDPKPWQCQFDTIWLSRRGTEGITQVSAQVQTSLSQEGGVSLQGSL